MPAHFLLLPQKHHERESGRDRGHSNRHLFTYLALKHKIQKIQHDNSNLHGLPGQTDTSLTICVYMNM